jgi:SAM-dependent methyltransferase
MMRVDPSNQQQAESWDGDTGSYWASHAETFDRSMADHHGVFMAAAAVAPDDRVLDVGCGTGQASRDAARLATDGSVLGIDLSSPMLSIARQTAEREGLTNVSFINADAQVHAFAPAEFDVVISRTGSMFFSDPIAAFTNLAQATRQGGRIALLTWQPLARNEWFRELLAAASVGRDLSGPPPDAPGPFGLADPERAERILNDAGFRDVAMTGHDGPLWFGEDVDQAFDFLVGLVGWMLDGLDDQSRARGVEALRRTIAEHCSDDGAVFGSACWIITATR